MAYHIIPPESQESENWCWAACLVWQGRAVNRQVFSHQTECAMAFEKYWVSSNPDQIGQVSKSELKKILRDSRFKLKCVEIPGSAFSHEAVLQFLKYGPFILGYTRYNDGVKHVNTVYDIDGGGNVSSMDPGGYMVGYSTGVYQGIYANRPLYQYKASSKVIVGYYEINPVG